MKNFYLQIIIFLCLFPVYPTFALNEMDIQFSGTLVKKYYDIGDTKQDFSFGWFIKLDNSSKINFITIVSQFDDSEKENCSNFDMNILQLMLDGEINSQACLDLENQLVYVKGKLWYPPHLYRPIPSYQMTLNELKEANFSKQNIALQEAIGINNKMVARFDKDANNNEILLELPEGSLSPLVRLEGLLQLKLYPGPPNYRSIENGDHPERCWMLLMDAKSFDIACHTPVLEPALSITDIISVSNPLEVQLGSETNICENYINQKVTVEGYLSHAILAHHYAPFLMSVKSIYKSKEIPVESNHVLSIASGSKMQECLLSRKTNTKLDLTNQNLIFIPQEIFNQYELEEVWFDDNHIKSLSPEIALLTHLKGLSIYKNELTVLPDTIFYMKDLKRLNVSANCIAFLPEIVGNLKSLEVLDINHNQLKTLPSAIGTLKNLQFLYLAGNGLEGLPESFQNLKNLLYLNVTYNRFSLLPECIAGLTQLIELRMYNNSIVLLPDSIGNLINLKELHAMNNKIAYLPQSIGQLKNLRKLMLENNHLEALPASIGELKNLTDLDLRTNRLHDLPETIGNMKTLRFLDLRDNKLTSLPASIRNLQNLEKLDVRLNKELIIPDWFQELEERGCIIFY